MRIATIKYQAGAIDLVSVLQVQIAQLASPAEFVKIRNVPVTNRINLQLPLGDSFDGGPAANPSRTIALILL